MRFLPLLHHLILLFFLCQWWAPTTFGFAVVDLVLPSSQQRQQSRRRDRHHRLFQYDEKDSLAQDALERTAAHLEKLQRATTTTTDASVAEVDRRTRVYLQQSAQALKELCKARRLPRNGRKPDLARRLAQDDLLAQTLDDDNNVVENNNVGDDNEAWLQANLEQGNVKEDDDDDTFPVLSSFAGVPLSHAAGAALGKAGFIEPTPIQRAALPRLMRGESLVLHAETGSGKSLAYLLPITEALWRELDDDAKTQTPPRPLSIILTPTRELAAQVAGVATVLAPPGTVRLVARPTNLASDGQKDRGEVPEYGGRRLANANANRPRILIGSAKAVAQSLYGDGGQRLTVSPTPKPQAAALLSQIGCLVVDEVDRCLHVVKSKSQSKSKAKRHEKPAALLCAAVARSTLGQCQVVAASATVGRPLKRELARVLGLLPHQCPDVVRGVVDVENDKDEQTQAAAAHSRVVTIPETVDHYIYPASHYKHDDTTNTDNSNNNHSDGQLLTGAYRLIQKLNQLRPDRKMLLVLSKSFKISTANVLGALKHFQCQPKPQSLLDLLEAPPAGGTDQMIHVHRQVSGAAGVGESYYFHGKKKNKNVSSSDNNKGYLLVTGEDTVRGLHLDGLDLVIVVGRPLGPDEYTHIAGRTGRAGRQGTVVTIVHNEHAAAAMKASWERMLDTEMVLLRDEENDNDKALWERL